MSIIVPLTGSNEKRNHQGRDFIDSYLTFMTRDVDMFIVRCLVEEKFHEASALPSRISIAAPQQRPNAMLKFNTPTVQIFPISSWKSSNSFLTVLYFCAISSYFASH